MLTNVNNDNKTPAKEFTFPAEKKMGTSLRWSFVKIVNEGPVYGDLKSRSLVL